MCGFIKSRVGLLEDSRNVVILRECQPVVIPVKVDAEEAFGGSEISDMESIVQSDDEGSKAPWIRADDQDSVYVNEKKN